MNFESVPSQPHENDSQELEPKSGLDEIRDTIDSANISDEAKAALREFVDPSSVYSTFFPVNTWDDKPGIADKLLILEEHHSNGRHRVVMIDPASEEGVASILKFPEGHKGVKLVATAGNDMVVPKRLEDDESYKMVRLTRDELRDVVRAYREHEDAPGEA